MSSLRAEYWFLRELWLNLAKEQEGAEIGESHIFEDYPDIEELKRTQMNAKFIELMEARMVIGTLRYGYYQTSETKFDHVESLKKRLELYAQTGNLECLVDLANIAMIEFTRPTHPHAHLKGQDDQNHSGPIMN